MADGSSGNISGVLFEAGKTISDAGKGVANAAAAQVTGNQKPLFNGQKPQTTGLGGLFPQKPLAGNAGQMPKMDPFGDFGKMFEGGKPGFGKKPLPSSTPQFSQADLDKMAAENNAKDQEEILKRQEELKKLQVQHKNLHDEVYYNPIKNIGENSLAQTRNAKAQEEQKEEAEKQSSQQTNNLPELPSNMMGKNPQLGTPMNVRQEQTKIEANRGTTG